MNEYKVVKGTIYCENGLPYAPRWFCDGRMALEVDNQGVRQIDYFGPALAGSYIVFKKRFWDGMRFYLNENGKRTALKPKKCEIMPFGYKSENEKYTYSIYTVNDCIFVTVQPYFACNMDIEFYDDSVFRPETHAHKGVGLGGGERKWQPFQITGGRLCSSFTENGTTTNISFSSNARLTFKETPRNTKYTLTMHDLKAGQEYVLAFSAANGEPKTCKGYQALLAKQFERYRAVAEKAPVLKSSHLLLNQYFQLAPLYHESLKTTDVLGAIRAQSTHYWVWGWDSMTSGNACFYWGDHAFMGEMLQCFEKHSDPERGIAHAFTCKMEIGGAAPPPAQGMYITLLDLYRLSGGDWQKHYPFAKKLIKTIFAAEVKNTGFCAGTSLYPDHRALIHETGNDISAFNNTVSYCAVRSMEKIAAAAGDIETGKQCKAFADRMRAGFEDIMYNENIGFIDSSVEADTYEKRNVPSNNAVKWENNYCGELVEKRGAQYLKFYEDHLVSPAGLRPIPEWNECYDIDANQLHCWWPVMSEFYIRLINQFNRPDLIRQYISWIEYWAERLMCPEGIPCYDNDPNVPFDNWNCLCGIWHGYSIRGFYNAVVHAFIGVDFDEKGLNIYPYSGEEAELLNLHFGNKTFNIQMRGSGRHVKSVRLNGEDLGAVTVIPFERFCAHNTVEVIRG